MLLNDFYFGNNFILFFKVEVFLSIIFKKMISQLSTPHYIHNIALIFKSVPLSQNIKFKWQEENIKIVSTIQPVY